MKIIYLILAIVVVLQLMSIAGSMSVIASAYTIWAKSFEKDEAQGPPVAPEDIEKITRG